jgi:hypothetical protein
MLRARLARDRADFYPVNHMLGHSAGSLGIELLNQYRAIGDIRGRRYPMKLTRRAFHADCDR